MDVDIKEIEAALFRIESQIDRQDFDLFKRFVGTILFVMKLCRAQKTSIARLRRLFGLNSSEKTADVLGKQKPDETANDTAPANEQDSDATNDDDGGAPNAEKPKANGHGRVAASAYPMAKHITVAHDSLKIGSPCPGCASGKLFELKEPARILRIFGQPALAAHRWDCQRLRCGGCGHVYTAPAPKEARGPKYDETAVSMIALYRYGAGLPHNRLEKLQNDLETPVPSSTQWDVLSENAPTFQPVFDEIARQAAQGEVVHNDDTYVRILEFMGKRRAELLKNGELADPERTGLYTTGIVSIAHSGPIALFYSGRQHAGENLDDLLGQRDAHLEAPILMSDALSRNVPKKHPVVEANCLAHGRRKIVDQVGNFPEECEFLLEMLRKVFVIDEKCREQKLSPEERMRVHQRESGPVMKELHEWMTSQFAENQIEPNSDFGKALRYLLKRWDKFKLFLRKPGAPIDNNICERVLKKAICHRRNSLFYRTQHGAEIGDMFMSLIHTAELHRANPFDYLTELQLHAKEAAERPAEWLPWNYRATLAQLVEHEISCAPPSLRFDTDALTSPTL